MRPSPYHRHPLQPALVVGLALLLVLVGVLFLVGAMSYAYRSIGIGEEALFALVLLSLIAGAVNIPVATWQTKPVVVVAEVVAFGLRYRLPLVRRPTSTILAVNLGGAVIPTVISIWLLIANPIWWPALGVSAIVTVVVHRVARPVPGLGIAIPALVPPALSAGGALLLASHGTAAVAYVSGTLGTLIGGDLLNLRKIRAMAPAVVSIGGRRHLRRDLPQRDRRRGAGRARMRRAGAGPSACRPRWSPLAGRRTSPASGSTSPRMQPRCLARSGAGVGGRFAHARSADRLPPSSSRDRGRQVG